MNKLTQQMTMAGGDTVLIFGSAGRHGRLPGPNGDNFDVCDYLTDGYSAVLVDNRPDGARPWNNLGGGRCHSFCFSSAEGSTVTFSAHPGVSSTGAVVKCGTPIQDLA